MRVLLILLALLLLLIAGTAAARDVAKNDQVIDGIVTPHANQIDAENRGADLVVSIIAGTFTDLGPAYRSALLAIGEGPVDLIYDPMGNWPSLSGYTTVLVTCSDLWWSGYFLAADEQQLAAHLDTNGCVTLIGQDYLYQRGGYAGFPANYLGVAGANEDANYNDSGELSWQGRTGGPLEGVSGSMYPCFAANPWFTDEISPASQGLVTWASPLYGPAEGGTQLSFAVFSAVEFACGDPATLETVMVSLLCGGIPPPPPPVATQHESWGSLKHQYR
ncbi:MAG: hypothetical protein QUU85_19045 [Candidatus Eisenbacteria bacterium]|nr:hypothetical protein [Candidatus Eisenbacteria bacterium]